MQTSRNRIVPKGKAEKSFRKQVNSTRSRTYNEMWFEWETGRITPVLRDPFDHDT